ncbi:hypothetical protein F4553_004467 [Allocatelliglobosispora scoriae]|uniref:Uncharacterized protein n=1 Tax=Allocatelliglobosispora scoriae TaxID=643052 RepID=A0A841BUG1_9ACTN|nr:hypothetical protein [Allocatelliglobosispora scoriae]MBB5871088.1 hypothetical protein [Allocatelliglobosispora scoriae]
MTTTPMESPVRQARLSHGWELVELALRVKFIADALGETTPKVGDLVTSLFLWENQREQVPTSYEALLDLVFDAYTRRVPA